MVALFFTKTIAMILLTLLFYNQTQPVAKRAKHLKNNYIIFSFLQAPFQ